MKSSNQAATEASTVAQNYWLKHMIKKGEEKIDNDFTRHEEIRNLHLNKETFLQMNEKKIFGLNRHRRYSIPETPLLFKEEQFKNKMNNFDRRDSPSMMTFKQQDANRVSFILL